MVSYGSEVDKTLQKLLTARNMRPGLEIDIPEEDISKIVRTARVIFLNQSMLLEVHAPLNICGDTHGQYYDLLRSFRSLQIRQDIIEQQSI